jgi:hypothetical protein
VKNFSGFMVFRDDKPMEMELCDDIAAGYPFSGEPFPVFNDQEDAREAGLRNLARYADIDEGETIAVCKVEITVTENLAEYSLNEDEEDSDE